jgi:hypothetical protein
MLLVMPLLAATPARPGPTVAVEDTLYTELPEELVTAPRVTLDEILDRVARGEARRDSAIRTQAFTAAVRAMHKPRGAKEPQLLEETVWRVYKRKPKDLRAVRLRKTEGETLKKANDKKDEKDQDKDEKKNNVDVDFSPGMSEEIATFAFSPEGRRDYKFKIETREILGDHLIYRIGFAPRSPIDVFLPTGRVWIDTNEFVIVRQEVSFDRSPVPILIKSLDKMIVERRRVGGTWVLARVMMRGELTVPMPKFGRTFEFAILYDDYQINPDLPDSVFTGRVTK